MSIFTTKEPIFPPDKKKYCECGKEIDLSGEICSDCVAKLLGD